MLEAYFTRTRTDLTKWFFAAYLMGRDKRGVSAKFLQRELGVADRLEHGAQAGPQVESEDPSRIPAITKSCFKPAFARWEPKEN